MEDLAAVEIDDKGTFKYIQIIASGGGKTRTVIRGRGDCEYHGLPLVLL